MLPITSKMRSSAAAIVALLAIAQSDVRAQAPVELAALTSVKLTLKGAAVSLVSDRETRTEAEENDLAAKLGFNVKKDALVAQCVKAPKCGPTLPPDVLFLNVASKTIKGASADVEVHVFSRETSLKIYRVRLERTKNEWKVVSLSVTTS